MPYTPAPTTTPPELRLVLSYPRHSPPRGVFDWLVRRLDLETYGDSLLTPTARSALRTQAAVLAVVYLFEVTVWTITFNMLFGLGYLRLGWHTLLALFAALVVALVMFFWERNIATLDLHDGLNFGTRIGIVLRVAIIGVVALFTSLPLELLLFSDEIRHRAYEEVVRYEFVVKLREHRDLAENISARTEELAKVVQRGPTSGDVDPRREARLRDLRREEASLRQSADVRRFQQAQGDEERKDLAYMASSTASELRNVRAEVAALEIELRRDQIAAYSAKCAEIRADLDCMNERTTALTRWLENIRKNDPAQHPELRESVTLRSCTAGMSPPAVAASARSAPPSNTTGARAPAGAATDTQPAVASATRLDDDPNRLDFYLGVPTLRIFDQVRILWALQGGRTPEWREADDQLVKEIQARYNLIDKPSAATRIYSVFAGMAVVASIAIPLMSLLVKLTGCLEVKNYYSLASQARAGNPEALHVLEIRHALRLRIPAGVITDSGDRDHAIEAKRR